MTQELIMLDLNKVNLYGWEEKKSDLVIDSIIRGIEANDTFPAVLVYRIDDSTYELTMQSEDPQFPKRVSGGHNRAVGHYIANKPLSCIVIGTKQKRTNPINIRDIVLEDDNNFYGDNISAYQCKKRGDPNYR